MVLQDPMTALNPVFKIANNDIDPTGYFSLYSRDKMRRGNPSSLGEIT